ncbi:MAG: hypothetical protein E7H83_01965 [Enterobacteriaceae bacterium]|uniref:hypothetical protein n=1 Tax=Phytobacter diazotrophicus TaxID=395631 RepID=UPI002909A5A7|nr:hypothetical protein [Phytobacter diazotrophicus]MDU4150339.1 hypothetical protein [Enterobacteriaceae bacterium]MDV2903101.1 hypothetical protein [Phytobacter diazotrophicus]
MSNIVKHDYKDGVKLPKHEIETWCGAKLETFDWYFVDAHHALLAVDKSSSVSPCKKCLAAIIKTAKGV